MKANSAWRTYYGRPVEPISARVTEVITEINIKLMSNFGQQFNVTMDWLEASQLADALHEAAAKAEAHAREPGDDI